MMLARMGRVKRTIQVWEKRGRRESYIINKCSLLDAVKSPMSREMVANKSVTVVSDEEVRLPPTILLRIMSQPDIPIKDEIATNIKPRSLSEAYGEEKSRFNTAQLASKLINGVKKKTADQKQALMLCVDKPYVLNDGIP